MAFLWVSWTEAMLTRASNELRRLLGANALNPRDNTNSANSPLTTRPLEQSQYGIANIQ